MKYVLYILLILLLFSSTANAIGLGASPARMVVDNAMKGATYERNFYAFNTGEESGWFSLTAEGDGNEWITFLDFESKEELDGMEIDGKGTQKLIAQINIPEEVANGMYNVTIYIQSTPKEQDDIQGAVASAVIRIPVVVSIDVTGTQILSGVVDEISLMDVEVEYPLRVNLEFQNTGNVIAKPVVEVEITKDSEHADAVKRSDYNVKLEEKETLQIEWNTTDYEIGSYVATVSAFLGGELLKSEDLKFEILPEGTLTRHGILKVIEIEGETLVNRVVKIKPIFSNTGTIDSAAKFVGEIYLNDLFVDAVNSDELFVPVGGDRELMTYYKIAVPGDYILKGKVIYSGKETDITEYSFNVPVPEESKEAGSLPGFSAISSILILFIIVFRSRER